MWLFSVLVNWEKNRPYFENLQLVTSNVIEVFYLISKYIF